MNKPMYKQTGEGKWHFLMPSERRPMNKNDITEPIESMIDKYGLMHVLTALELICEEKAEHIRVNWQDNLTARRWDKDAKVCGRAARSVTN